MNTYSNTTKPTRRQKQFIPAVYEGQFKDALLMANGKYRLKFLVYNSAEEQYEQYCTNSMFTAPEALTLMDKDSFEAAKNTGFKITLGLTDWGQNTITDFAPYAGFVVPVFARKIQEEWQSKGNNREAYHETRLDTDVKYKLANEARWEAWKLLKGHIKYSELIGCSHVELRNHYALLFRDGMTFENYGTVWEADHRIPLSKVNLLDPAVYASVCHYTNLQPLLVSENRAKYSSTELEEFFN